MTTANTTLTHENGQEAGARGEADDGDLSPSRRLDLIADLLIHGVARALLVEDLNAPKDDDSRDGGGAP